MALLAFFDKFVQLFSDERREVEVLLLNPLVLVLPNGDCLPFHCNARYTRYAYNRSGRRGAVGPQQNNDAKFYNGGILPQKSYWTVRLRKCKKKGPFFSSERMSMQHFFHGVYTDMTQKNGWSFSGSEFILVYSERLPNFVCHASTPPREFHHIFIQQDSKIECRKQNRCGKHHRVPG